MASAQLRKLTAEEIEARMAQETALHSRLQLQLREAEADIAAAQVRQKLRRQLEDRMEFTMQQRLLLEMKLQKRASIDNDECGENMPFVGRQELDLRDHQQAKETLQQAAVAFDNGVREREFVWQLSGLSWLPYSLKQEGRECAESKVFEVDVHEGDSRYILVFSPHTGSLNHSPDDADEFTDIEPNTTGTLALVRREAYYGSNLFVSFHVRNKEGNFIQWGLESRLALPALCDGENNGGPGCCVLGPDVRVGGGGGDGGGGEAAPRGVFGLTYEQLLGSEWVQNDTITFKVDIKEMVMPAHPEEGQVRVGEPAELTGLCTAPRVEVPPSTLAEDMFEMLQQEHHTDVVLEAVYDGAAPVAFKCHANVLSQRSPVFRAALSTGMREADTRSITICDFPPEVLKALLCYLYTDNFELVQKVLREAAHVTAASNPAAASSCSSSSAAAASSASSAAAPPAAETIEQLQQVLAASHKYQVGRLLRWAESQLCDHIRVESVCALLALSHLYDGSALEQHCLRFLRANTAAVVERPEFASLPPRSLVKFSIWAAGVEADPTKSRKRARCSE